MNKTAKCIGYWSSPLSNVDFHKGRSYDIISENDEGICIRDHHPTNMVHGGKHLLHIDTFNKFFVKEK